MSTNPNDLHVVDGPKKAALKPLDPSAESAETVHAFEQAALTAQPSFVTELFGYLKANKKWWQLPIVVVLLLLAVLLILGGTGAAPFIYTLF